MSDLLLPVRILGGGLSASCVGLGCMSLTQGFYGQGLSEEESIGVVRHALKQGITLFNTSDLYGPYTNETMLGKALQGTPRESVVIATKWGPMFEGGQLVLTCTPEYARKAATGALQRLQTPYVDLFTLRGPLPPDAPLEAVAAELKALVADGLVRHVGLSEVSAAEVRRVHAVVPVTAIEQEWSLFSRDIEEDLLPTCRELGIGVLAYSPLSRGLLTGGLKSTQALDDTDFRKTAHQPRFADGNLEQNLALAERVVALAAAKGCTPTQLALAWLLAKAPDVIPIPGTRRTAHVDDFAGAARVTLTAEEVERLEAEVPHDAVAGGRYGAPHATYHGSGKAH